MPSEDGNGVVNWVPLTMAIFKRKQDMPSEDWGEGGDQLGSSYDNDFEISIYRFE